MYQFPFNKSLLIKQLNSTKNSTQVSRAQSKSKKLSNSHENFKKFAKSSHPEKFFCLSKEIAAKKNQQKIKITKQEKSKSKSIKKLSSKSFQQKDLQKIKSMKITIPDNNLTKIRMINLMQNYQGQYEIQDNKTFNKFCLNHQKKLSEFHIQIDQKIEISLCSYCTVSFAEKNYSIQEILTQKQSKELQLENLLTDIDQQIINYDLIQKQNQKILLQKSNNENYILKDLNKLLLQVQNTINRINKCFFNNYLKIYQKEKSVYENLNEQFKVTQIELKKIKEDICQNYDSIIEKVEDKNFDDILNYFNEKLDNIKETSESYQKRIPLQPVSQITESFLINFEQFYKSMLFNINPYIQINNGIFKDIPIIQDIKLDPISTQNERQEQYSQDNCLNLKKTSPKSQSTQLDTLTLQIPSLTNIYTQRPEISVDIESIRDDLREYSEQIN